MKRWLLALLLLFPLSAQADELRVNINMAAGQNMVSYSLTAAQTREFWRKWRELNDTSSIVPMPSGNSYGGLTLYDSERYVEVRLYNGTGRSGDRGKTDDYRQLERWTLGFAPPPLGPALIAALDETIRAQPGGAEAMPPPKISGTQIVTNCRLRAGRDARQKAFCLHEQLLLQMNVRDYATALEQLATEKLPAGVGTTLPDAARAGSR